MMTEAESFSRLRVDDDAGRPGVLQDVGHRLLDRPVDRRLDERRQPPLAEAVDPQLRGDPGPPRPLVGVVRERLREAEVVERGGAQFQGHAMDVPADQGGVALQPPELFLEGGVLARRVLGQPQAEHQGRELLAHLVVQLAGDPPPLVFLDRHDPPEQLLADLLLPPEGRERLRQRGRPLADPQVQLVPGPADLLLGPLLVRDVEDRADIPEVLRHPARTEGRPSR